MLVDLTLELKVSGVFLCICSKCVEFFNPIYQRNALSLTKVNMNGAG